MRRLNSSWGGCGVSFAERTVRRGRHGQWLSGRKRRVTFRWHGLRHLTRAAGRYLGGLAAALSMIAEITVALMMLHIAFEVTMRYVFGISVPGTLTMVSKYYLPAVVFLPLALAERRGNHISVEVLTQLMPGWAQRVLGIVAWLLSTVVFAVLAYQTFLDALKKTRIGSFDLDSGYQFDTWPSFYLLPVGFGAITLVLIYKLLATAFREPDTFTIVEEQMPSEPAVLPSHGRGAGK